MGIMRSLGTVTGDNRRVFLISQNKIKLLLITIHKVYLHKPYAPPQPTSLVLLVILASGHLLIHASKAAN